MKAPGWSVATSGVGSATSGWSGGFDLFLGFSWAIPAASRAASVNAVAERFVGSARRELLDHVLLLDDRHLESLLRQYKLYFNESRPHQGIGHRVPANDTHHGDLSKPIAVASVLGGLHVDYRRAA